jgi:hypothetical protein
MLFSDLDIFTLDSVIAYIRGYTFFFAFRVACMVEVVEVLVKVAQHNDLLRC